MKKGCFWFTGKLNGMHGTYINPDTHYTHKTPYHITHYWIVGCITSYDGHPAGFVLGHRRSFMQRVLYCVYSLSFGQKQSYLTYVHGFDLSCFIFDYFLAKFWFIEYTFDLLNTISRSRSCIGRITCRMLSDNWQFLFLYLNSFARIAH